jgi:uncharacterized protein (DUF1778 family)
MRNQTAKKETKKTNLRLEPENDELLRLAKKATGASFKFLINEAVRRKYSKFAIQREGAERTIQTD